MKTAKQTVKPADSRPTRSRSPLREFLWLTAATAGVGGLVIAGTSLLGEQQPLGTGAATASTALGSFINPAEGQGGSTLPTAPQRTLLASEALAALRKEVQGEITVTDDSATASKSFLRAAPGGDLHPTFQRDAEQKAEKHRVSADTATAKVTSFLSRHGAVFGIQDAAKQLALVDTRQDQYGHTRVSYQQMHQGLPVSGAVLRGHVSTDGRLTAVNGKFVPSIDLPTGAQVTRAAAARTAVASVTAQQPSIRKGAELSVKSSSLMIYRTNLTRGDAGTNHLVYEVQVGDGHAVREFVYVDAQNGKIVDRVTGIQGARNRRVYEGTYDPASPELPPPFWREGDPRPAADPAHEDEVAHGGYSYNLFFNLSGGSYRSWDGNDAPMVTVNNDPTILCPNANWNGTSTNYCSGTSADDVVAHEWAHAYTQETSGLIYAWQSGALNESYSDIFGETVDQIDNREGVEGTAATGNDGPRSSDDAVCSEFASEVPTNDDSIRWLMGEDAFAFTPLPPIGDAAIRDMWRPRCAGGVIFDGNAGHASSHLYHCAASDGGGVHANSAINNRAYALLADGDTVELRDDATPFQNPVTVQGIGLTKAAHIFWRANSVYNTPATNFRDNADALEQSCRDLVGVNLTRLVSTVENGTGMLGANNDTIDPTTELSGEVITAADCQQVANAIAAVEMRHDVTQQCGFRPMLDSSPAPMCGSAAVRSYFSEDWENGVPASWSTGQAPVSKTTLDTRPWFLRSGDLPANPDDSPHPGSAMYQENRIDLGNCSTDDESGQLFMDSPDITVDAESPGFLAFEHYVNTEVGYDGGNVRISINGGEFTVIPSSAFVHNPYNGELNGVLDQNTNPKAGEEAWHGGNPNEAKGDWGQSQIDLSAAGVSAGDTIRLRFDFGQDGCNGNDGWYVDRLQLFACGDSQPPPAQECRSYPATMPTPAGSPILFLSPSVTTAAVSGESSPVSDINIRNLTGTHPYMGDLAFRLRSPAGTEVTLFDGAACGAQAGIDAKFDDEAGTIVGCNSWLTGNAFRPQNPLSAFDGQAANGNWTLTVTDRDPQDEGLLQSWSVEMCRDIVANIPPVANNDTVRTQGRKTVTINVLANDSDADGDCLRITSVTQPANGVATLNSGSCEEANRDSISYRPSAGFKGDDTFFYTVSDGQGGNATATVTVRVGKKDDDDHDKDGQRDDRDDDDDNDGRRDDADDDDDNDGHRDSDDADDDNDGIEDRHDNRATDDETASQPTIAKSGSRERFVVDADASTLVLIASARGNGAAALVIDFIDASGRVVGTSVPTPEGPLAVISPSLVGNFSVVVRNPGSQAIAYELTTTRQQAPATGVSLP